jgi:hypothetical protein
MAAAGASAFNALDFEHLANLSQQEKWMAEQLNRVAKQQKAAEVARAGSNSSLKLGYSRAARPLVSDSIEAKSFLVKTHKGVLFSFSGEFGPQNATVDLHRGEGDKDPNTFVFPVPQLPPFLSPRLTTQECAAYDMVAMHPPSQSTRYDDDDYDDWEEAEQEVFVGGFDPQNFENNGVGNLVEVLGFADDVGQGGTNCIVVPARASLVVASAAAQKIEAGAIEGTGAQVSVTVTGMDGSSECFALPRPCTVVQVKERVESTRGVPCAGQILTIVMEAGGDTVDGDAADGDAHDSTHESFLLDFRLITSDCTLLLMVQEPSVWRVATIINVRGSPTVDEIQVVIVHSSYCTAHTALVILHCSYCAHHTVLLILHALIHALIHAPTHALIHALIHALTHALIHTGELPRPRRVSAAHAVARTKLPAAQHQRHCTERPPGKTHR